MRRWSDADDTILRRDARDGTRLIATARELERPVESIRKRRQKLGLTKPHKPLIAPHHVRITCDGELYERVSSRASSLRKSVASYIRSLIHRDLGIKG